VVEITDQIGTPAGASGSTSRMTASTAMDAEWRHDFENDCLHGSNCGVLNYLLGPSP
jgi:hypothetical protein